MNTKNLAKTFVAGLSLIVISGCANTRPIESDQINTNYSYKAEENNILNNNIRVETASFKGTSKFGFSGRTMPALDNEEAKQAIVNVLTNSGFYNPEGEYQLIATMKDDHTGMFTTTRGNIISYELFNIRTKDTLFNEEIKGEGETTVNNVFFGNTYETAHRSGSAALEDNFKNLVNLLSLQ